MNTYQLDISACELVILFFLLLVNEYNTLTDRDCCKIIEYYNHFFSVGQRNMYVPTQDLNIVYVMNLHTKTFHAWRL